jgi:hypothetical protein
MANERGFVQGYAIFSLYRYLDFDAFLNSRV